MMTECQNCVSKKSDLSNLIAMHFAAILKLIRKLSNLKINVNGKIMRQPFKLTSHNRSGN